MMLTSPANDQDLDAPSVKEAQAIPYNDGYHNLVRTDVFGHLPTECGVVLDVGGGIGATSAFLKKEGRCSSVVLIDLVDQEPFAEVDHFYRGDINEASFLAMLAENHKSFDTILCLDVLEHLVDPWTVLGRLTELLSEGGSVVISLPNARNFLLVRRLVLQGTFALDDKGIMDRTHLRWFARRDAVALATSSGLRLVRIEGKIVGRRRRLLNAVTLGMFRGFFELQYLITVQRD